MTLTILFCGDRNWDSRKIIANVFDAFVDIPDVKIISGGCAGADTMAFLEAKNRGLEHNIFMAMWDKYGNAAGPIRNQRMLDEGKPDLVIAVHDNISKSKGTLDMIRRARTCNVPVLLVGRRIEIIEVE